MTAARIRFAEATAGLEQIAQHLSACDQNFVPPLTARLDLASYAAKIAEKAVTFEAWREMQLVGLVAVYLNDPDGREAFVTSVSVVAAISGRGIGAALLGSALDAARERGFQRMNLEVHKDNRHAIAFYRRFGFLAFDGERDDGHITMYLPLAPGEAVALSGGLL